MVGGSFTMKANSFIKGNVADGGGGVVMVGGGVFTMEANSVIEGNEALIGGGVLMMAGGSFEMKDGAIIRSNVATLSVDNGLNAGGVVVIGSTFNMSGGSITENECKANKGVGGVIVASGQTNDGEIIDGTFKMTDKAVPGLTGNIKENTCGENGTLNFYLYKSTFVGSIESRGKLFVGDKDRTTDYENGW